MIVSGDFSKLMLLRERERDSFPPRGGFRTRSNPLT